MNTDDYIFSIIEDNTVPLAGAPPGNYFPLMITVLIFVIVILILLIYYAWYAEHRRRIIKLQAELEQEEEIQVEQFKPSFFHPKILTEAEKNLEQQLAEKFLL